MLYNETKVNKPEYVFELAGQNIKNLTVPEQKIWLQY